MNAKEYLLQVGMIDARLKVVEANINRIRRELLQIGDISVNPSWPDGQPHGRIKTDPTGNKASKLADMTNEKRDKLKAELLEFEYEQISLHSKLWSKRMEIIDTISQVQDVKCYRLLCMRYIDGDKWEKIALDLDVTYQWVAGPLHGKALSIVQNIINKKG